MSRTYDHLHWTDIRRELRDRCGIFDLYAVTRQDVDGNVARFTYIDAPDWVTIIPRTTVNGIEHFVMVRQYRHGLGGLSVEFPAGVSESDESPVLTARRELLEETGYSASSIEYLGDVCPNPALMNNTVYTFLATGLQRVQEQKLDQHEILDVELVPVEDVISSMGLSPYSSGIMMIALAWYLRR